MPRFALLLLLALAPAAPAAPAAAQLVVPPLTEEQAAVANQAMTRLRSPYTASHTVDMCPSAGAVRDSIRVAAAAGFSSDEIVEDFVARHGERLRLLPKRRGAGLLAWIATPLVILVGGALVWGRFRGSVAAAAAAPPAPPVDALSPEERGRLDAAMRELETAGEVEG